MAFFFAWASCVVSLPEEIPEPPFSLRSAWPGRCVWGVLCFIVVGGDPQTPLLSCARPGRCARLGLLRRACDMDSRSFSAALGLAAALGLFLRVGVLRCTVAGGDPRTPLPASLGLAAALGLATVLDLAFFGVRTGWIAVVGGDPRHPPSSPLRSAWPGRCAWLSSACRHIVLYRSRGRHLKPPFRCARPGHCARPGLCFRLGLFRRACKLDYNSLRWLW